MGRNKPQTEEGQIQLKRLTAGRATPGAKLSTGTVKLIISALLLLMVSLPAPVLAAGPDNGIIEGTVVSESQGSTNVTNQQLTLNIYLNDSETGSKTARTDVSGRFTFDTLPTGAGYSYDVTVSYHETDYTSESIDFNDGNTRKSVKITVYDSTTTDESVRVPNSHTIIYAEPGSLLVKQYAQFTNDAKLTYIGAKEIALGKRETLRFFAPKGATEMQYGLSLMQCCIYPGDESVSDTMVVLPGSKEVSYSYRLPCESEDYTLTQKFFYPTGKYDLLVQGDDIGIAGGGLVKEDPVTIEGQLFSHYSLEDAGAGQILEIRLSGLPKSGVPSARLIVYGLVAAALVAVLGYVMLRRRAHPAPAITEDITISDRQTLLLEIARMDDSFEAGEIAEDVYRSQRAAKKHQLLELMRDIRKTNNPRE